MSASPFDEFQRAPDPFDEFQRATPPVGAVLKTAVQTNPDDMAEAVRLAKRYPAPVDSLYRNLPKVRFAAVADDAADQLATAKALSQYLASRPHVAGMAHDDIPKLKEIESNFAQTAPAAAAQAVLGISEGIWRTPDAAQRAVGYLASTVEKTGLPPYLNPIRGVQDVLQFISEGRLPVGPKLMAGTTDVADRISGAQEILTDRATFGNAFADVQTLAKNADQALATAVQTGNLEQVGQVLTDPNYWSAFMAQAVPSLYLAMKSGGSVAFMGWLEGMEQASNAAEFEKRTGIKVTDQEFTQAFAQTAIVNALLERYGLDKVLGAKGNGLKGLAKAMAAEGGTEGLQQINSNLAALLAYNQEQGLTEGVLASVMGGVASGGGVSAAQQGAQQVQALMERQQQQARAAAEDAGRLQQLLGAAGQSLLRERSPEDFRAYVQTLGDKPLYVDGEVLNQLPAEVLNQLPESVREQIADAAATGDTVEIPMADVLTVAPGTPLEQVLNEHARMDPFASSKAEVAAAQDVLKQEAERVIQQAADAQVAQQEFDTVKAMYAEQIAATGRYRPAVAEQMGTWIASFYTAYGSRVGMTPTQFQQRYPVRVAGVPSGQGTVLNDGGQPGRIDGVEAYHYSMAPRAVLSSSAYGTGLRGSARDEIMAHPDKRLRHRISFYVDKGTGVRPEAGVGGVAHRVNLDNIYDANADPLRLRSGDARAFETRVLDAGFSGYLDRLDGDQPGQVILLGEQNVTPEVLGPVGRIEAGKKLPALQRKAAQWKTQASGTPETLQARLERMQASSAWQNYDIRIEGNELQVREKDGVFEQADAKVNNLTSVAERGERVMGTRATFSPAEKQAIKDSAAEIGVSEREITAVVRGHKLAHPPAQGWAPLTFVNAKIEVDEKGKRKVIYNYQNTPYTFSSDADGKALGPESPAYKRRVNAVARAMVDEVRRVFQRAAAGDKNAKNILAQAGWYKAMRERLRQEFGGLGDLFADLLGATSPNTPVRDNWTNAVEVLRRASRGDYDAMLPKWVEWADKVDALELDLRGWFNERMAEGLKKNAIKALPEYKSKIAALKEARKLDDSLLPTKETGKKYGFNGKNVARAMVDLWRVVKNADPDIGRGGTAPKALNFSGNLIGFRERATIDVWAARMLQRLAGGLRVPSMAETGVSGDMREDGTTTLQFGFGQDVFSEAVKRIRADEELKTDKVLADINDDDLQAVVWFVEKELWTVNNWTSAAGEGGSFELEASLTGTAQQDRVKALRKIIDSSKSKPAEKAAAREELATLERSVDRFVGGLSIQMSADTQGLDFVPSDADMARLAEQVRLAVYEGDGNVQVLASKVLSTEGRYGGVERSLDLEVVAREGYDASALWLQMLRQAQAAKQDSTFLSRVLRDDESPDPARHRPGVEIYFREAASREKLEQMLGELAKEGVEFLTVIVDGRRSPDAVAGAMPPAVGVRLQYVPEFEQRYGMDSLSGLDDAALAAKMSERAAELDKLAARVAAAVEGVSFAGQFWYETQVAFSGQYQEKIDALTTRTAEGQVAALGGGVWTGESVRAGLEGADRQARETARGEPDGGTGEVLSGDALRQDERLEQSARGTFNPATLELVLNPNANLSTWFHETGHFFLEVMADVASQPGAPAQIVEDFGTFLKWAGVTAEQWRGMTLDQQRPYHERWAESIEQYVMEGKAPSVELQPLMRRFAAWLKSVYGSIKQFLAQRGVPVAGGEALNQITPQQALETNVPVEMPVDPAFAEAVGNTAGAQVTPDGLLLDLVRFQKGEQEGAQAIRTGVFYLPKGSPNVKHYRVTPTTKSPNAYGGTERMEGQTLIRRPLFVKGSTGGKAPEVAYDTVKGKGAMKALDKAVMDVVTSRGFMNRIDPGSLLVKVEQFLRDYGGEPGLAWAIIDNSKRGNTLRYALQEHVIAHAVRAAGYDAVVGYSKGKAGASIAEVFDVREQTYPARGMDSQVHDVFMQGPAAPAGPQMALNDDIRRVMDRMLATDEQIQQANEVAGLVPDEAADGVAEERLRKRSIADLKWAVKARDAVIAKLKKEARAIEKRIREEVTAEVNQMREVQAKDMLAKSQKENGGKLNDTERAIIADAFSYESVDAMLQAIDAFGSKADVIDGMTEQRMLEEHGDLIDERAMQAAANEAVHNEARARSLATELRTQAEMLNPRTDTGETTATGRRVTVNALVEAAKQFAANVVGKTSLRDLKAKAWQHTAAERRASKRWQEATAAGKTRDAVKAKQDQMLNHAAAKAAIDAQAEARKILDFFARVTKGNDETVVEKGRDADLVNAARAVLAAYGVQTPASKGAEAYLESLAKHDPETYNVVKPMVDAATQNAQPLEALTFDELQALHEEVQAMWFLAKRTRQMEVDGDLLDIDDVAQELYARMEEIGIPDEVPGERGALTRGELLARQWLQQAPALLRRVEQWAEAKDGKFGGPFLRFIFQPVKDAADRYRTARLEYRKKFQSLVDNIAPMTTPGTIDAPELGYVFGRGHNGGGMAELLHAIAHTGNESNERKLLLGRQWATELPDGTLDTSRWDAFIQRLANEGRLQREHFDFVQGVWDLLEETKPLAQKTHREVFGRYFAEVTADAFVDPFGVQRRGGYIPAQADPLLVQDADLRDLLETENVAMSQAFPQTNRGFTKSRVEYNRPLKLDLRTLPQHIDKVLLFAHMEPAVRGVARVLRRPKVSQPLARIDPAAMGAMLKPWLNRSARQTVETPISADAGLNRMASAVRGRVGMALMFANVSNTLQQITGSLTASIKVKPGLMMRATAQFIANPKKFKQSVWDISPYMADRAANEVAVLSDTLDKILVNPSVWQSAEHFTRRHAYFLQTAFDNQMSPIIWTASYNQALADGVDERMAVRFADGVIRQTQGSTLPEDVSRIETGPAYARLFTQFVGYFNMMANTNATAIQQIAAEQGLRKGAGKAFYTLLLGLLAPIWVAEAIAHAMRGGPDDEDDDGWLDDWLVAVFGFGTIRGLLSGVPFLGAVGQSVVNRFNRQPADDKFSLSPTVSVLESAAGAPASVYKAIVEDKSKQRAVRDTAALITVLTGLPAMAVARPLGYAAGVLDNRIDPAGPADMARGLVTGTASPESRTP